MFLCYLLVIDLLRESMKIFICCLFIISFVTFSQSLFADYYSYKIVVKFKENSILYQKWINSDYNYEFDEFKQSIGEHIAKTYLSKNILNVISQKQIPPTINQKYNNLKSIQRICLIEYKSTLDPLVAIRKLSSFDDFEYVDIVPKNHLVFIPNDSALEYQQHLFNIEVFGAWDLLDSNSTSLIGIVDTGVDYLHPDLADNIYNNPGEIGLDEFGNDKRFNGIDDDGNGFIDDWMGWDFVSGTDNSGQDNDPMAGNPHGTHVAGIAAAVTNNNYGIAGVAIQTKILPVKIGADNPASRSVENAYDGLLYAAMMGADVINCSWGSSSGSQANAEIVRVAQSFGSLIVAAAGNDNQFTKFYPAAYPEVLSVACVDNNDNRAYFSNFHPYINISAPGVNLYSTMPFEQFAFMSGTSMSSPVVAGVSALVNMKYNSPSANVITEIIKANSDNIDKKNHGYIGKIGKGRVNALKALKGDYMKSLILLDYEIIDQNNDGMLDIGERIYINLTIKNVLDTLKALEIEIGEDTKYRLKFSKSNYFVGDLPTNSLLTITNALEFTVPEKVSPDQKIDIWVIFKDITGFSSQEIITIVVNPSYRNFKANNIHTTINSRGNIGYNDYPANFEGIGFKYKGSNNLLFEGALMVGAGYNRLSNVARASNQSFQDEAFYLTQILTLDSSRNTAALVGTTSYSDYDDSTFAIVSVNQAVYQFDGYNEKDFIILTYDVINRSDEFMDSLFVGLYFDWDIGPMGEKNQAVFNFDLNFGYIKNMIIDTLPLVGTAMLSDFDLTYFAIDNDAQDEINPGVWDGFTPKEKWSMLSGDLRRYESNITDASQVIGAGPITLKAGDTTRIIFAVFCGHNENELTKNYINALNTAKSKNLIDIPYRSVPEESSIVSIYPNPGNTLLNLELAINNASKVSIHLYDINGKLVDKLMQEQIFRNGYHHRTINLPNTSQGAYFLQFTDGKIRRNYPYFIAK